MNANQDPKARTEESPRRCPDCLGTGRDEAKTKALHRGRRGDGSYIRCHTCNGNGLNPAAYFRPYSQNLNR